VAHAYNPSCLGGKDQEDLGLTSDLENSSRDPISKIPNTKRACVVAQGVGAEFKPWYCKKTKKTPGILAS
jgi:hypothetical protein